MIFTYNIPLQFSDTTKEVIVPLNKTMEGLCLHIITDTNIILEGTTSANGGEHFLPAFKEAIKGSKAPVVIELTDKRLFTILKIKVSKYNPNTKIMLCHGSK